MSERENDVTELQAIHEFVYDLAPTCKRCEGEGQIDRELMPTAQGVAVMPEACPDCRGSGEAS